MAQQKFVDKVEFEEPINSRMNFGLDCDIKTGFNFFLHTSSQLSLVYVSEYYIQLYFRVMAVNLCRSTSFSIVS